MLKGYLLGVFVLKVFFFFPSSCLSSFLSPRFFRLSRNWKLNYWFEIDCIGMYVGHTSLIITREMQRKKDMRVGRGGDEDGGWMDGWVGV